MSLAQLSNTEYKRYLTMDKNKHLLVEGRDDSRFFQILFEEFVGSNWQQLSGIVIDKAETLISSEGRTLGNREKIEEICNFAGDNLVGFVDREFREFKIADDLFDNIQNHYHSNRLVWSRGHSIENYFFEIELLRRPFQDVSGEDFYTAFELFIANMNNYLKTACLLSLMGLNFGNNIRRVEISLTWKIIASDGTLDMNSWRKELVQLARFTDHEIDQLFDNHIILTDSINQADTGTIRWLCHGHIGYKFLWLAFARCIYDATSGEKKIKERAVNAFLGSQQSIRFNLCGRALAQASINGMASYPSKVFELLGLALHE